MRYGPEKFCDRRVGEQKYKWTSKAHSYSPQQSTDNAVDLRQHRDMKFSISTGTQLSTAVYNGKRSLCD